MVEQACCPWDIVWSIVIAQITPLRRGAFRAFPLYVEAIRSPILHVWSGAIRTIKKVLLDLKAEESWTVQAFSAHECL